MSYRTVPNPSPTKEVTTEHTKEPGYKTLGN